MYPSNARRLLSPAGLARFDSAYNNKKLAIGWWDRNREAVGLIQAYLHSLGYDLRKSVKVTPPPDEGVTPDGAFGTETFNAVVKFQKDNKLKPDGAVGEDTFDALGRIINGPRPASHGSYKAAIIEGVRRPCRPNDLICPEP